MPEEAVTPVEKGSVAAGDECAMLAKAEMATHGAEMRAEASWVYSAESWAMHPKPSTAVHAAEATTCKEREGAWCCWGFSNLGTRISVGWKRER